MKNIYYLVYPKADWGDVHDMVIIAEDEKEARELANTRSYGEGKIWDNLTKTICEIVDINDSVSRVVTCNAFE